MKLVCNLLLHVVCLDRYPDVYVIFERRKIGYQRKLGFVSSLIRIKDETKMDDYL